jgi:radical SAM superfamily enzyme YgiQ (UPF0313 family)
MNITIVIYKYNIPLEDPCCYPLGVMYISARAKSLGHTVKVLNYNLYEYDFTHEINDQDVVMFTGFEEFYSQIVKDAATCRSLGIKTIVGGALATFLPDVMDKICDTVVTNEGDGVVGTALRKSGIVFGYPGVWWDILPDYEGIGITEYHKRHNLRYMGVLASHGCPYACTFCAHTCDYQLRPLDSVMAEIDSYVTKYNIIMVVFNDNTLNASPLYFDQLITEMKKRNCMWSASIRLDHLNASIVRLMKESGCVGLVVGVESFNQSRLDKMNKGMTVDDIYRGLDLLHKYEINYHGNVIVGLTGETMADIKQEILSIPSGYNIFPTFAQPFVGVKEQCKPKITARDKTFLKSAFNTYITARGKYTYPELPEMRI